MSPVEHGVALPSAGHWGEAFRDLHGQSRIRTDAPPGHWGGRLSWRRSTGYGLALCSDGAQKVDRQAGHIRADPRGTCELLVPLSGTAWVQQGSSEGEVRPGQMMLCDVDRPYAFAHRDDFRSVALIMAKEEVTAGARPTDEPQVLDATSGLGRLVRQAITTLQDEQAHFCGATFDLTCERLVDLVRLASEGQTSAAPPERRGQVEADIRRYVRLHAADPDLGVHSIARALGWSARYVQQVLQGADTTPRHLVRQERLRLARVRLGSADWASSSIGQIAASCGFGSHAAFSTAFRLEFAMSPREARHPTA